MKLMEDCKLINMENLMGEYSEPKNNKMKFLITCSPVFIGFAVIRHIIDNIDDVHMSV